MAGGARLALILLSPSRAYFFWTRAARADRRVQGFKACERSIAYVSRHTRTSMARRAPGRDLARAHASAATASVPSADQLVSERTAALEPKPRAGVAPVAPSHRMVKLLARECRPVIGVDRKECSVTSEGEGACQSDIWLHATEHDANSTERRNCCSRVAASCERDLLCPLRWSVWFSKVGAYINVKSQSADGKWSQPTDDRSRPCPAPNACGCRQPRACSAPARSESIPVRLETNRRIQARNFQFQIR